MKDTLKKSGFVVLFILTLNPFVYSGDLGVTLCFNDRERASGSIYPYNQSIFVSNATEADWWDNIVEEVAYAGLTFIAPLSRGFLPQYATSIDAGNPYKLANLVAAMDRRGVGKVFKIGLFDDCPTSWTAMRNKDILGSFSTSPVFDCADTTNYKYIWENNLKIAISQIPDGKRYKIDGRMVIFFWSVKDTWFTNQENGNLKKILMMIRTKCQKEFGFNPYLIVNTRWLTEDSSVDDPAVIDGVHNWFSGGGNISWTNYSWNNIKVGCAVPGFYYPEHDGSFINPNHGQTLIDGLNGTVNSGAITTLCEGFTDAAEAAAMWRSNDTTYYDYPNQRINILRRYTNKAYPELLKVEAEGCDNYYDLTDGNSGGAFRVGDIDIVKCSDTNGGWNVTNTQSDEWMEWKELPLNVGLKAATRFELRYKSISPAAIKFSVDGISLSTIELPSTNNEWETIDAGIFSNNSNSLHTVRLTIVSGNPDINYFNISPVPSETLILQAEDAVFSGAKVATGYADYHGTGYVDYINSTTDYIEWTVNAKNSGNYNLSFRYALAAGNRPLELKINGTTVVSSFAFPATGSWSTWGIVSTIQNLNIGNNTIRLTSIGSSGGNFDELVVTPLTTDVTSITNNHNVPLSIYPNPVQDLLHINGFKGKSNIIITNISGQEVMNTEVSDVILVNKLPAGIYFLKVGKSDIVKFIKSK